MCHVVMCALWNADGNMSFVFVLWQCESTFAPWLWKQWCWMMCAWGVTLWPVKQCRLIPLGVWSGWCDPLSVLQQWRHAFTFHPRDFDTLVLHYVWLGVIWSVFCQAPSVLLFALCTVTLIWRHSLPLICESRPVTSTLFGISGSVVPTYCEGSLSTLPAYRIPYY